MKIIIISRQAKWQNWRRKGAGHDGNGWQMWQHGSTKLSIMA